MEASRGTARIADCFGRQVRDWQEAKKKRPVVEPGAFHFNSLTMTYFHTGIRTIIGAEAFHCPVRDGKEWGHFAMVIRLNFSLH